jgi:hypothetical protein
MLCGTILLASIPATICAPAATGLMAGPIQIEWVLATSHDRVVKEVAEYKADLGVSKLSITPKRELAVDFSRPYLASRPSRDVHPQFAPRGDPERECVVVCGALADQDFPFSPVKGPIAPAILAAVACGVHTEIIAVLGHRPGQRSAVKRVSRRLIL